MPTLYTVAAAAAALLLAACGEAPPPSEDPAAEAPGTDRPGDDEEVQADADAASLELSSTCENPDDGYRISYPEDWHANDGEVTAACQVFDVEVSEVEPNTVLPLASSVLATVEDRAIGEMRALIERDPATQVDELAETEIEGRQVLRVDGSATGEAYLDEGVEVHRTYVELGDRTLIVRGNELGEPDLELRRATIADMVATVERMDADEAAQDDEAVRTYDGPDRFDGDGSPVVEDR